VWLAGVLLLIGVATLTLHGIVTGAAVFILSVGESGEEARLLLSVLPLLAATPAGVSSRPLVFVWVARWWRRRRPVTPACDPSAR
jgi:hypothetical protein